MTEWYRTISSRNGLYNTEPSEEDGKFFAYGCMTIVSLGIIIACAGWAVNNYLDYKENHIQKVNPISSNLERRDLTSTNLVNTLHRRIIRK